MASLSGTADTCPRRADNRPRCAGQRARERRSGVTRSVELPAQRIDRALQSRPLPHLPLERAQTVAEQILGQKPSAQLADIIAQRLEEIIRAATRKQRLEARAHVADRRLVDADDMLALGQRVVDPLFLRHDAVDRRALLGGDGDALFLQRLDAAQHLGLMLMPAQDQQLHRALAIGRLDQVVERFEQAAFDRGARGGDIAEQCPIVGRAARFDIARDLVELERRVGGLLDQRRLLAPPLVDPLDRIGLIVAEAFERLSLPLTRTRPAPRRGAALRRPFATLLRRRARSCLRLRVPFRADQSG